MNNDLISRSALKEQISELHSHDDSIDIWLKREDVDNLIDNAPTVEYPFYQEAYQTGYEEGKNEILKGKCKDCDLYFKAMTKEEMRKGGAE